MLDPACEQIVRRGSDRLRRALLASTSLLIATTAPVLAQTALPTHGSVVSGAASISQSAGAMTVDQTSERAILNWNSFSIGPGGSVSFVQPNASAAALNRVTGSTSSEIAGRLDANGQVFLVNPNGIAITPTGAVNVGGGFVASTLGIDDRDFNSGHLTFSGGGASAAVSNAGTITAAPGGFVGLLGGSVSNSGTISVPLGKIGLGSGEQATLDPSGDGFLQVALPTNATTANGQALVDVSGKVKAAGGVIAIKAATAANAVRNAINLSGVASARSARARGGSIILDGGAGGDVAVTGVVNASGHKAGGSVYASGHNVALTKAKLAARGQSRGGGSITIAAANAVSLAATSADASGATGGGTISIGGDATLTSIDVASLLRADALADGNGGSVTVRSTGATTFAGQIYAQGGAAGGDGGAVETSGATVQLAGAFVDTLAPQGRVGLWLIDPTDFTIAASGGDVTGAELSTLLSTASVKIASSAGTTSGPGDIYVDDAVSWSSANSLSLQAERDIDINAPMTASGGGGMTFDAARNININAALGVTGGAVSLIYGDTSQTGVGTSAGAYNFLLGGDGFIGKLSYAGAGGSLTINGADYTLVRTLADLQDMSPSGDYALANSVTLAATLSADVAADFYGTFEGLGNTIAGLSIATSANAGFLGVLDTYAPTSRSTDGIGTLRDFGLIGGTISGGGNYVGALAAENYGQIFNSYSTDAVSSSGSYVGGLVGANFGTLSGSFARGAVSGGNFVGGLVGENQYVIDNSFATGGVRGGADVGGLVGLNDGLDSDGAASIAESFAMGAASGSTGVGGLAGANSGSVTDSFAAGAVSGVSAVGGLVGAITGGSVATSYWDIVTSGQAASAGGTGLTTAQLQGAATIGGGFALGSAFAGGAAGGEANVYPYLASFFPKGVQAISGFAYGNASLAAAGISVSADVSGLNFASATTGANGYYYIFGSAGAIPSGANVLVYSQANATTDATDAASLFVASGADNDSGRVLYGSTLTEPTLDTLYSQLSAGLADAAGADSGALAAIAGVSNINITASGASFTIDQAITTPANLTVQTTTSGAPIAILDPISAAGASFLTTNGATTTLSADITTSGGAIAFNSPVVLGDTVTLDSRGGLTSFAGAIDGSATPNVGLTVAGPVSLGGNVTTDNGALTFDGPVTLATNVVMNSGAATTTFGSTIDSGAALACDSACRASSSGYDFTATAGALSFGGAIGGADPLGAVSLTSTAGMVLPSITAQSIFARTIGGAADLTLGPGTILTASNPGAAVTLAAGYAFINESGANAIDLSGPADPTAPSWQVYSNNPTSDVFNGLTTSNAAIYNATYGVTSPTGSGNYYLFASAAPVTTVTTTPPPFDATAVPSPSVLSQREEVVALPQPDESTCAVDIPHPDISAGSDPIAAVEALSSTVSRIVERCRNASQADIGDALDRYADALAVIAPKLPPALRNLPAVIHAAAARARAAPTRAGAVRALRMAVAEVHREILLVRAEDPDSARKRDMVGAAVAGVLNSAALTLARSEGI